MSGRRISFSSAGTRASHSARSALLGLACVVTLGRASTECREPWFDGRRTIEEAGSIDESADACWWLSSGAQFELRDGIGRTVQGDLPRDTEWHRRYAESNPVDTDDGAHPQNLLRLVARDRWVDFRQEVRFRIQHVNLSKSAERGEWSGVLLFLRYQDAENLYYAGLRMDGTAVIKKKLGGQYTTLAQQPVYAQPTAWDRDRHPSLLPMRHWIGLAAAIRTDADGSVHITVSVRDGERHDGWRRVLEAVDEGRDGPVLRSPGHAGLRGDFMDLEFSDYAISGN